LLRPYIHLVIDEWGVEKSWHEPWNPTRRKTCSSGSLSFSFPNTLTLLADSILLAYDVHRHFGGACFFKFFFFFLYFSSTVVSLDCAEWQFNRVFWNFDVCTNMPAYTASTQSAGTSVRTLNIEYPYLYRS
jgi:hypothetical protein